MPIAQLKKTENCPIFILRATALQKKSLKTGSDLVSALAKKKARLQPASAPQLITDDTINTLARLTKTAGPSTLSFLYNVDIIFTGQK